MEDKNYDIERKIKRIYYSGDNFYLRMEKILEILLESLEGKLIVNVGTDRWDEEPKLVRYLIKKTKANAYGISKGTKGNLKCMRNEEIKDNKDNPGFQKSLIQVYDELDKFVEEGILIDDDQGNLKKYFKKNTVDAFIGCEYVSEKTSKSIEELLKKGGYFLALGVDGDPPSIKSYINLSRFRRIASWHKPDPAGGWYSDIYQKIK